MFFYFEGNVYVFNVELRLGINFFLYSFMMKLDLFMVVFLVSMILYIFFGLWEVLEELMDWKENWNVMWCLWFWIYEILVFDRKYGFKFYFFEKEGGLILRKFEFIFWFVVIWWRWLFLFLWDLRLVWEDLMFGVFSWVCSCSVWLLLGNIDLVLVLLWDFGFF